MSTAGMEILIHPKTFLFIFTHFSDNQKVGVLNKFSHEPGVQTPIKNDRIPVILVHVITRGDCFKLRP